MSFKTFRDSFLTEAEERVTAVDPTTATTNDMLVAGSLYKMAASVASVDLISTQALSLLTTMSGAQLEAYLQDPDAMLSFQQIVADTPTMNTLSLNASVMNAIVVSTTAMNAIAASTAAMNAIAASTTAMNAIASSSTAMNAINASSLAIAKYVASLAGLDPTAYADMNAIAASSTAMNAIASSSTAMNAIVRNSTASTAVETALQNHRSTVITALSGSTLFTKTTATIGSGSGTFNAGAGTATVYIPTSCRDDNDTDYTVNSVLGNGTVVSIPRHSDTTSVSSGLTLRGTQVVGSGSSVGNVTFDVYTAV